jgi:hypothetical protein
VEDEAAAEVVDGAFDDSVCVNVCVPTPIFDTELMLPLAVVPELAGADDADVAAVVCDCCCCCCC